jgi:UDP-glucose 4-epimerase
LDKIFKIVGINEKHYITFIRGDIRDTETLNQIFATYRIHTVMHFAALKSVNESQKYPVMYYQVNVKGTINLLNTMSKYYCKKFIYSSSATVYGNAISPVSETTAVGNGLTCNYAQNKYDMEQYLIENEMFADWNIVILRYFNPIGAHPSGKIGEDPSGIPNNIFPYLLRVAKQINHENKVNGPYDSFTIFGNDYTTRDGTCIRDYVHVQDLARAHVDIMDHFDSIPGLKIYNVGTGKGTTVMELIDTMNRVLVSKNKSPIPYRMGDRRSGDLDISYANVDKIYNEIGFKTELDINDMCVDGLNFVSL